MRTLFATIITALALAVPAAAAEMPKELQGVWCSFEGNFETLNPAAENVTCDSQDVRVAVTARGFDSADDYTCEVRAVEKYDVYPWGKRANPLVRKNPYGQPYRIRFRCTGETGRSITTVQKWEPTKGYLTITDIKGSRR